MCIIRKTQRESVTVSFGDANSKYKDRGVSAAQTRRDSPFDLVHFYCLQDWQVQMNTECQIAHKKCQIA